MSEQFDVCIIGAGFAGSVLAQQLASSGKRVAILEAGDWRDRNAEQTDLAQGSAPIVDAPETHTPIRKQGNVDWSRAWSHNVGGTVRWSAIALRPLENHFRMRSLYGVGEDWPLSYDELEPDYCRAEDELGVSGNGSVSVGPRRSRPYPMPAFPPSFAETRFVAACAALGVSTGELPVARNRVPRRGRDRCCFSGFCSFCPTTAKYRPDLVHVPVALATKNVTLFTRHSASKLVLDGRGRVERIVCSLPDRTTTSVTAGVFVVACNSIESARLLLLSTEARHAQGLANSSGALGRFLMDHLTCEISTRAAEVLDANRSSPAVICRHFEDGASRTQHGGWNFIVGGGGDPTGDALRLVELGTFGVALKRSLRERVGRALTAEIQLEMLPRKANGVVLDRTNLDHFGRPGLALTINADEYELAAKRALPGAVAPIFRKMGGTEIEEPGPLGSGFHSMGVVRMGRDPAQSVVDPDLRAHDVENLFVASSAVFPNSLGATNPTLTLVALSLRLARHLLTRVLE